jgi:general secretion pathway protein D
VDKTVEYKDVEIRLTVTPRINEKRFVALKIHQEVSKVMEKILYESPVIMKREAETSVVVKDRETIIIGGLIKEDKISSERGISILSKIPILGWLFKRKEIKTEKTKLMIFITPHVVGSAKEAKEPIREQEERLKSLKSLPEEKKTK